MKKIIEKLSKKKLVIFLTAAIMILSSSVYAFEPTVMEDHFKIQNIEEVKIKTKSAQDFELPEQVTV